MQVEANMEQNGYFPGVSGRDPVLDAIRSLAIVLVISAHGMNFFADYRYATPMMFEFGLFGVEIFFVLSGFLVGGIVYEKFLEDTKVDNWIWMFLTRRWFRTLPNYYLFLIVALVWERYYYGEFPNFLSYLFLLQNFSTEIQRLYMQSWSLPVEEFFYIIFPVMLLVVGRIRLSANVKFMLTCTILFVASLALRANAALEPDRTFNLGIREVVIYRLDSFMIGALAYAAYRKRLFVGSLGILSTGAILTMLSILSVWKVFGDLDHSIFWKIWWTPITSIGLACLMLGSMEKMAIPSILIKPVEYVARWSYSMYLSNSPLVLFLLHVIPQKAEDPFLLRLLYFLSYFGVTVIVSAATYRFFEKPTTAMRDRWTTRRRGPVAVAQTS